MQPQQLAPLATAVDHLVWAVPSLDDALASVAGRMGFPLLYGPAGSETMRMADVGFGSLWVRLVERREWRIAQPLSLALRAAMPLDDAVVEARLRGFESGGVYMSGHSQRHAGERVVDIRGHLPSIAFILLRGVVTPDQPGLMLVRYCDSNASCRQSSRAQFARSVAANFGVLDSSAVCVEVASDDGLDRWTRVLGRTHLASGSLWRLSGGGTIEATLGAEDRIVSIALHSTDIDRLRSAWTEQGIACDTRDGMLSVDPRLTGGLCIQVRPTPESEALSSPAPRLCAW